MQDISHSRFSAADLEVFITTYNRADYLRQAIKSVVNQTTKAGCVTVLDNASTDNTSDIVESFKDRGVVYCRSERNNGGLAQAQRVQRLAKAKYAMILHDDDMLHPQYIEMALLGLNHFSNIAILTSRFTMFRDDRILKTSFFLDSLCKETLNQKFYFFEDHGVSFAASLWWEHSQSSFSGFVSDTSLLRAIDFEKLHRGYGKNMDWPLMIELASRGNALVLADNRSLLYRMHAGQDSADDSTGVTEEQLLNWGRLFHEKLAARGKWRYSNLYARRVVSALKYHYNVFAAPSVRSRMTFDEVVEKLYKEGALTKVALLYPRRKESIGNRIRTLPLKFAKGPGFKKEVFDLSEGNF